MLEVLKISVWNHRPPNLPQWRVLYLDDRKPRTREVFAEDEMEAYADTVRWYNETFGRRCDQNP